MIIGLSTSVVQRGRTGIAQYVFSLLRAFQRTTLDARFVLFVLEADRPLFSDLDDRFAIVTVSEKFRPPVKNILWHQSLLPKLAAEAGLDLLHVPSYRRLLWRSPCPRVATIHDLAPFRVSRKYDLARMFYGRVVVKRLAWRQNEIIAVSQNTAADIERFFGIPRSRVNVIYNGLNHDHFYPRNSEEAQAICREKFGLREPFFLYVARLEHPGKNHVRLIEAFERFQAESDQKYLLAFGGSDWHGAAAIHQRIAASPCRDKIRPLGFVADNDLPWLYSAARGFVYPSLYEGFGLPPLEAMACACPVICSARGSLGEVVGEAAGIINPENVAEIGTALVRLGQDPSWRDRLVKRGLDRARKFSWTRTAEQTFDVYQHCRHNAQNRNPSIPISRLDNAEVTVNDKYHRGLHGHERDKAQINRD